MRMNKFLFIVLCIPVLLYPWSKGAWQYGGPNKGAWEGDSASSGCTASTITRASNVTANLGDVGKWGHAITGTADSTTIIATDADSVAMIDKATKDTVAYRGKIKGQFHVDLAQFSCGSKDSAYCKDSLIVVGDSVRYAARVDTAYITKTFDPTNAFLMSDSVTVKGSLPSGYALTKTGANIGRITATTPPDTQSATAATLICWNNGFKVDSGSFNITIVYGTIKIDSVASDTIVSGDTITGYGRNYGIYFDSLSGTMGGSACVFLSCSNDTFRMITPTGLDTGFYDLILSDANSSDTLLNAFFVEPQTAVTQFTLTMVNSDPAGTIIPTAGAHALDSNTTQAISHTPAAGYRFHRWTRSSENAVFGDSTLATTTITIRGNVTVTAVDTIIHYTRTMVNTSPAGTMSPAAGTASVDSAASFNLTFTPPMGYRFWRYTRSGLSVVIADSSTAATTAYLTGDGTITANDSIVKYSLTMAVDGGGTTVPSAGVHVVDSMASTNISHTPATGNVFWKWGRSSVNAVITDTSINSTTVYLNADAIVTAYDTSAKYMLTMATTTGGTVTPSSGIVNHGVETAIEMIPLTTPKGYTPTYWTRTSTAATIADSTDATTTVALTAAATVTGHFTCTASTIAYTATTVTCTVGVTITPITPDLTGEIDNITVSPALSTGLSLNASTGSITGTPTVAQGTTQYIFTANNCNSGKDTINITVISIKDTMVSCYPRNVRSDVAAASRIVTMKYHGPFKATTNTVLHLGSVSLGQNASYTDSTVVDTVAGCPSGYYRSFITDPAYTTMSDTILNVLRVLTPTGTVTNPQ
jgi:S-ribosylhomocysteine lyase LuxS involved in autoinducer biosynthesis